MDKRRVFSREFKLVAVKKVVELGVVHSTVARDLGVSDSLIRKWKKAFDDEGSAKINVVSNSPVEAELTRLREENRQLEMERDILRKATAFFARENT
jgi:transposase